MALEHEPLGIRQLSRLAQDLLRDRKLAEVVQRAGEARQLDLFRVETDARRHACSELRHALRMRAGVSVACVDGLRQRRGSPVSSGQVGAGRKPLELRELDDVGPVQTHAILAVLFRPVERRVRQPDQFVASVSLDGEGGEARADRDAADVIKVESADSFDDRVRSRQCRALIVFDE